MANETRIVLTARDDTTAAFSSAQRSLSSLKMAAVGLNGTLATMGASLSVGAFAAWIGKSIDAADALNDLSIKTGASVETLAALKFAADQNGTSLDAIGAAIGRLNKNIGEAEGGNKDMAATLKALGISAHDPEQALIQLAAAVERMPDPTQRAAALNAVLGKSYADLLPMLSGGAEGMRQMIARGRELNPITKDMAANADRFNDAIATLKQRADSAALSISGPLVQSINLLIDRFDAGRKAGRGFFGSLGNSVAGAPRLSDRTAQVARELTEAVNAMLVTEANARANRDKVGVLGQKVIDSRVEAARAKVKKLGQELETLKNEANIILGQDSGAKPGAAGPDPVALPKGGAPADPLKTYLDDTTKGRVDAYLRLHAAALKIKDGLQRDEVLETLVQKFFKPEIAAATESAKLDDQFAHDFDEHWSRTSAEIRKIQDAAMEQLGDMTRDAGVEVAALMDQLRLDPSGRREAEARRYADTLRETLGRIKSYVGQNEATQAMEMAINAIVRYRDEVGKLADAKEHMDAALGQRGARLAEIQAMVNVGLMTETQARRDGVQSAREALLIFEPHIAQLNELAQKGYPEAVEAMARFNASLIELRDQAQEKTWMDGISAGLRDYAGAAVDTFAMVRDATKGAFRSMENALLVFVKTGKLNFKDLASSIVDDLIRIQIQQSITKPLAGAMSTFNWSSLKFWADGGVPGGAGLHAYANQIVSQPTLFKFASGAGLMGEAGPEAIMPLTRGPDGKLGVTAQGSGGGVRVVQHIAIDARGADAGVELRIAAAMRQAQAAAVAEINRSLMRGGRTAQLAGVA